ncbi:glucose-1-phosphate cytidylyltransferase [Chengkuizengella axinellae]|uniref:Glucose-1-phosphate cytidylyltransferase n=1 Tax=Chengkuizengella axinellae TaxID=3064388 RepID=A0ABT9J1M0_9BACL|nr:glucose-1-phosphate cytidylyltransferase [Chengkuizengella sp. 2205SS18-9]MDP5275498.1 glucose-1-phosphate cytidylyltransferase [Chengkuizengella sp. 2205SS18-9]
MRVVILAGGFGTRISEESYLLPKPMIEIGERPMLWHIMKYYSHFGYNDFVICCGYKQYVIKSFFSDYFLHLSDVTFDFTTENKMIFHNNKTEPWKVTLIDTGLHTMTGGRIKRIKDYIEDRTFMLTYGDGLSNVNIKETVEFHKSHGKKATITAIQPSGRFGMAHIDEYENVTSFNEKPKESGSWINGGFMILNTKIMDYIEGDETILEQKPLETLAKNGQLKAFRHQGFWQCMDTKRDKELLENLWRTKQAPWKVWAS